MEGVVAGLAHSGDNAEHSERDRDRRTEACTESRVCACEREKCGERHQSADEVIGGGQQVYDAVGMTLEKHRSDLFRHSILGLGSGDLTVKTSGAQAHQFEMLNVLFIGKKVQEIEDMLKKKAVIESR